MHAPHSAATEAILIAAFFIHSSFEHQMKDSSFLPSNQYRKDAGCRRRQRNPPPKPATMPIRTRGNAFLSAADPGQGARSLARTAPQAKTAAESRMAASAPREQNEGPQPAAGPSAVCRNTDAPKSTLPPEATLATGHWHTRTKSPDTDTGIPVSVSPQESRSSCLPCIIEIGKDK